MTVTELLLVRHGESLANVASRRATSDAAEVVDIEWRDPDVPLSERGRAQAAAVGRWLAALPAERAPRAVWSSPYVRALDTVRLALDAARLPAAVHLDERLRDRELGVLDRLTSRGRSIRLPAESDRRRRLGKLYYRPPGGESWADVALRLRSYLRELDARPGIAGPVLIGTHDAVIQLVRYVLEELDEPALLGLATNCVPANGSLTRLVRSATGGWTVAEYVDIASTRAVAASGVSRPGDHGERATMVGMTNARPGSASVEVHTLEGVIHFEAEHLLPPPAEAMTDAEAVLSTLAARLEAVGRITYTTAGGTFQAIFERAVMRIVVTMDQS